MKIAVVIPVYNAAEFLERAVYSALAQNELYELILIEDCSKDNSFELCKLLESKHEKVRLLQHPDRENHGAGASRNLGIKNASCDYVAFLDADDYYLPNRFEAEKKIFENHPDAEGIYGALGIDVIEAKGREHLEWDEDALITLKRSVPPKELFKELLDYGTGNFHGNTLTVKKRVFEKAGYFSDLELGQDVHMWIRLAATCNLYSGEIAKPVAMYGIHENNRVGNKRKLDYFRPIVFESLIKWGLTKDLSKYELSLIWFRYWIEKYASDSFFFRVYHLIANVLKYPWLIYQKTFYRAVPLVARFVRTD